MTTEQQRIQRIQRIARKIANEEFDEAAEQRKKGNEDDAKDLERNAQRHLDIANGKTTSK
jgi:hypothetical protein